MASTYNSKPWQVKISQKVGSALNSRKDWLGASWISPRDPEGREVKLLDYACGTGAVTKALGAYVHTIRGIDISENMVTHYNEAARSSGLSETQTNAVVGDLLGSTIPDDLNTAEYHNFDIAVIGLGFHHFEDPALAAKRLTERLKPATGVLVIVDFLPFEPSDLAKDPKYAEMQQTIKHNGFTSTGLKALFEQAGLEDFDFATLPEQVVMELKDGTKKRTLFIAKGRKQPTMLGKMWNWVANMQGTFAEQTNMIRVDGNGGGAMMPRKDANLAEGGRMMPHNDRGERAEVYRRDEPV
jgi:SAM-dependent methyltransferase